MLAARVCALRWRLVGWLAALVLVAAALPPTGTLARANAGPPAPDLSAAESAPRIGLQAGHWRAGELPDELARLRTSTGGSGGGLREVDVNLAVANRVAEQLQARGYLVDVLPATVPPAYRADLFLAIHADAVVSPVPRGFKLARGRFSRLPSTEDALVAAITDEYRRATGLPWSSSITRNMTGYYAFTGRRFANSIDATTPGVILEMGYLTNAADRALLTAGIDRVVDGIGRGIVRFIEGRPLPNLREQPSVPAPAPDCRRFAETGQEICGPFKRAWEERGGLARFGLPISAEVEEGDPATGSERTVQYFERARFEQQPELAGTPDEIQFGLLGRVVTADRATEGPFAPIQPFADTTERRYFPESGHSLAGGFNQYWAASGGLDAYGFPISEEFTEVNPDDGKSYTVQYFERARFEYHPEARGTPYLVQLGRLGRLALSQTQGRQQQP